MHREFPEQAAEWPDPVTRRQFLTLMGASLALAGRQRLLAAAGAAEKIVPYVRQPEEIVPGKPLFFATAMTLGGIGHRPAGREPRGPADQGRGQPRPPGQPRRHRPVRPGVRPRLYDPDRSQTVTYLGRPRAWDEALRRPARRACEQQRHAAARACAC